MATIPDKLRHLLEEPNIGALATVRPDGAPQVNPMWFEFDGSSIRFTHTNKRGKFRNLERNPAMALMVFDPKNPYSYIEVRGRLTEAVPDPTGSMYVRLGERYGNAGQLPPPDIADRVILVMTVEKVVGQ